MTVLEVLDSLTPDGEDVVPLMAVLHPEWVASHTPYADLAALVGAAGYDLADFSGFDDFDRVDLANLIANTDAIPFATFGEMVAQAGADWQAAEAEREAQERLAREVAILEAMQAREERRRIGLGGEAPTALAIDSASRKTTLAPKKRKKGGS